MKGPDQFDDSRAALTGERRRIGTRQPRRSKEPAVPSRSATRRKLARASDATAHRATTAQVTAHSALVADYATGLTQVQIAEKYGLHVQTVRKRLIAAGVDTRARLRVLTDEDLWAARAAIDDGASVRETARGTWRRTHDDHPVAGTSSRSTEITIAHHEGGPADLDDVGSHTAITIAHHVGNSL